MSTKAAYFSPEISGAYFEIKCRNLTCNNYGHKQLIYLGTNFSFDYHLKSQEFACNQCFTVYSICNLGFFDSKWSFKGENNDGNTVQGKSKNSYEYTVAKELKEVVWNWLIVKTEAINRKGEDQSKRFESEVFIQKFEALAQKIDQAKASERFSESFKKFLEKQVEDKKSVIELLKKNLQKQKKTIESLVFQPNS